MLVCVFFLKKKREGERRRRRRGEPELSMLRLGDKNIALLAVGSFTTDSSRFASYVTNGLSSVAEERGIC